MLQKKLIISVFAVIGLALASITLWLTELIVQNSWIDSSWLWSSQYAVFGIDLFASLAYLIPIHQLKDISWQRLWMPGLQLYFIGLITFFLGKSIIYSIFSPFGILELDPRLLWLMLATLIITTASSVYYLTRNYLYPVKGAFIPLLVGVQVLVVVLSAATSYLFLSGGLSAQNLVESVRVGIPFFYFTLLLGLFSIFCIRKLPLIAEQEHQEEILDDVEFPG
ncbi:MAG: hypothetical protein KDD15_26260 [Lewinella sp.]|nr:hypothetical protein [Lewinella sp.]